MVEEVDATTGNQLPDLPYDHNQEADMTNNSSESNVSSSESNDDNPQRSFDESHSPFYEVEEGMKKINEFYEMYL